MNGVSLGLISLSWLLTRYVCCAEMCRALLDTMKCESPREDDVIIEIILYILMGINSTAGSGVRDPGGLQATLLAILRDILLESGTQPPPGLDRLVFRSQRIHLRRQRRRQREALRRQLQQSEGDTNIADHTAESPTVGTDIYHPRVLPSLGTDIPDHAAFTQAEHRHPSHGASHQPLQHPRQPQQQQQVGDASQLMAITQGLHISQLTTSNRHQVSKHFMLTTTHSCLHDYQDIVLTNYMWEILLLSKSFYMIFINSSW